MKRLLASLIMVSLVDCAAIKDAITIQNQHPGLAADTKDCAMLAGPVASIFTSSVPPLAAAGVIGAAICGLENAFVNGCGAGQTVVARDAAGNPVCAATVTTINTTTTGVGPK